MPEVQLELYNSALLELGERKLISLTENREPRRILDTIWDRQFLEEILQAGQWNFALRTVKLTADPDVDPDFGYQQVFAKPDDWVRTTGFSEDEYFEIPSLRYRDEAGFWYSDFVQVYVQFVSSGDDYGSDYSKWPPNFKRYAEVYMASRACRRITQDDRLTKDLTKESERLLMKARSTDAMDDPSGTLPPGSWQRARKGRRGSNRERRQGRCS